MLPYIIKVIMKDKRYTTVKKLMESGNIGSFAEIFDIVPRAVVASDLGLNYYSLRRRIEDHQLFIFKELIKLADLIECSPKLLTDLVLAEIVKKRKRGGR